MILIILQTARIYSGVPGKSPGWRSAVGLYCKFNRCAVYIILPTVAMAHNAQSFMFRYAKYQKPFFLHRMFRVIKHDCIVIIKYRLGFCKIKPVLLLVYLILVFIPFKFYVSHTYIISIL